MNILATVLLLLVASMNAALSVAVYRRNREKLENKYFSIFLMLTSVWALSTLMIILPMSDSIIDFGLAIYYIAPPFTANFVLLFSLMFQRREEIQRWVQVGISLVTVLMTSALIIWPDFFYGDVEIISGRPNELPVSAPGFYIYAAYFALYFAVSYAVLIKTYLTSHGLARLQMRYAIIGIIVSSFAAVITNAIMPIVFDSREIWLGPVMTLFFSGAISYAILVHHLFDVRVVLARSISYGMTIGSTVAVYFVLTRLFIDNVFVDVGEGYHEVLYVLFALLVAWAYPVFQSYFDRFSREIVESDYYDIDTVQDNVSDVLAEEIDIDKIMMRTCKILASSLKPKYVRFVVFNEQKVLKDYQLGLQKVREFDFVPFSHLEGDVVVLDDRTKGRTFLHEHHAEVAMVLRNKNAILGGLLLGGKQSEAIYTEQDERLLRLISRELSIAIDNSINYEQLQTFNVNLKRRISRAVHSLEQSNEELKQMDKTKDEFVSLASHQLRTPLTSIKGYISMILEGDAGDINDDQRKLLSEAFASSERMVYLIADLLNVSRLQAGTFIIDKTEVHLPSLIRDEMNQVRETAKSANIDLRYSEPKSFPTVMLDETKIRQVIMNFIDNAIYYTPGGGVVTVRLAHTNKHIEVTIKDTGMGVPKEAQKNLFNKFFRADNAKRTRPDGTGIGLYMAKKVVAAQGGAIIFESQEGKGSTFGFSLPLSKIKVPPK